MKKKISDVSFSYKRHWKPAATILHANYPEYNFPSSQCIQYITCNVYITCVAHIFAIVAEAMP